MPQQSRYISRKGVDLGPQERIALPGAEKAKPQKRFADWQYKSWEWPQYHQDLLRFGRPSEGRSWRAPRTVAEAAAIVDMPGSMGRNQREATYLAATLVLLIYEVLVSALWGPSFQFSDEEIRGPQIPIDGRQSIRDLIAAWAAYGGDIEPGIPQGGFPPWMYDPDMEHRQGQLVVNQRNSFMGLIRDELSLPLITGGQGYALSILAAISDHIVGMPLYAIDPLDIVRYVANRTNEPAMPWWLEAQFAEALLIWWENVGIPTLMTFERTDKMEFPRPWAEDSDWYMGTPWWLVVLPETRWLQETESGRELLTKAGGAVYSVHLWNPLDAQYYASAHNPFTTLYLLEYVPEDTPDDEEEREELWSLLQDLLAESESFEDYNYQAIRSLPRLTGHALPDPSRGEQYARGAIYNDYFNVTENLDEAVEDYHERPHF